MARFDNSTLTDKCLTQYAATLRKRLTMVSFMLDEGQSVQQAVSGRVFRVVMNYTPWGLSLALDDYMRTDGSINENTLAEAVAAGLAEPLIVGGGK